MNRTITHKHLKRQLEILEETEDLTNLFLELQFSTLLLPTMIVDNVAAFPTLEADGKCYAPVFTDIHEYNKCQVDKEFTLVPQDFNFYLDLLYKGLDGIVIDVEGARLPITKDIGEYIKFNYIFDYEENVFTMNEIRRIRNSVDNSELEEFLNDKSNHWDLERLMELLLKSDLFMVLGSVEDISNKAEDGVISLHDVGSLPIAMVTKVTQDYALIYSSENEIKPKNNPIHPYSQLVNLPRFINKVLMDDLDGIILNENSQNITIPRQFLLDFMRDFNCPLLDDYTPYAFVLPGVSNVD